MHRGSLVSLPTGVWLPVLRCSLCFVAAGSERSPATAPALSAAQRPLPATPSISIRALPACPPNALKVSRAQARLLSGAACLPSCSCVAPPAPEGDRCALGIVETTSPTCRRSASGARARGAQRVAGGRTHESSARSAPSPQRPQRPRRRSPRTHREWWSCQRCRAPGPAREPARTRAHPRAAVPLDALASPSGTQQSCRTAHARTSLSPKRPTSRLSHNPILRARLPVRRCARALLQPCSSCAASFSCLSSRFLGPASFTLLYHLGYDACGRRAQHARTRVRSRADQHTSGPSMVFHMTSSNHTGTP